MSKAFDFILHIAALVVFVSTFTLIGLLLQGEPITAERDVSTLAVFRGE